MNNTVLDLCHIYNGNISNIDGFRCSLTNFAAFLYAIDFGYICMGLIVLIIFISIFGGIQHNYKWFILNQAIWDLLVSHKFSCGNWTMFLVKPAMPCFYTILAKTWPSGYVFLFGFFYTTITNNPYSCLLLISGSRFMAIFYDNLYDKLTRGRRILWTIIIFNIVATFFELSQLFVHFRILRADDLMAQCMTKNFTRTYCFEQIDKDTIHNIIQTFFKIFSILGLLKPILCLLLSIIAATMLIWKLVKQTKFQKKHNPIDFNNSVRITIVILFQTLINFFVLILESFNQFLVSIPSYMNILVLHSKNYVEGQDYTGYIDLRLPLWLDGYYGLSYHSSRELFIQIRVFIECILVLFVMTGYREAIMDFAKKVYSLLRDPTRKVFPRALPNFVRSVTSINETTVF